MGTTAKKKYPKGFWICGCTEIFERLSYYLGRSLILIFVTASVAEGGLGLSNSQGAIGDVHLCKRCTSPIALAGVPICILPRPQVDDYVIFLYFYENTFAQSCF